MPVLASSELNETAAVAPVAREPGAPSPALAPPLLTAAPPASAPVPVLASSEPKEIHTVVVATDGRGERIHPRHRRSLRTARHAPQ